MRNNEMIHLIQTAGLNKDAENVVLRAFDHLCSNMIPDGCLGISISICIALEYLGYSPKLCLGRCVLGDHHYYHAWTELNMRVIDVAIFGNSSFSPHWRDKIILPQVNRPYFVTDIRYEPFVFDNRFKQSQLSSAMGMTYYEYCNNAPCNIIWDMILIYLNDSTHTILESVKNIARKHIIGERDKEDGRTESKI